ncbi:AAA family ATPase [Pectobacterium aroidearum]|uniref:AAA family ATPase n=1 Tax=Pectobacterium aroidearum TaxID=1201031 RepID=UPI0021153CE9|nr:AAA family ATPase [Pectobacterium aroidearum]UUE58793.1 AAA family ATPase [Pectobacterium aroidearum]UUE71620.1 AAA family ATPase [Pectobacterium aroidearum]UUE76019.1 AAA family ATPase [Pectobacterium aroidearum]UUE80246.1 AAA family ATPase [Pectobacterium aroidearum]
MEQRDKPYLQRVYFHPKKIRDPQHYPFSIPAISDLEKIHFHPDVTFLVGENGSGKSTLLEAVAIAMGFNPEGGSRNFNFSTRDSHSSLSDYIRIVKGITRPRTGYFLRAESFFNVATEIENIDPGLIQLAYGGVSLHQQSHGESFMALLNHRFGPNGFYLLDEPEAALSPTRQLTALARIHQLVNSGCQFIIATHSPIILAYPSAVIYQFDEGGIQQVAWQETDHYQITRQFLNNPQGMMDVLFADDDIGESF